MKAYSALKCLRYTIIGVIPILFLFMCTGVDPDDVTNSGLSLSVKKKVTGYAWAVGDSIPVTISLIDPTSILNIKYTIVEEGIMKLLPPENVNDFKLFFQTPGTKTIQVYLITESEEIATNQSEILNIGHIPGFTQQLIATPVTPVLNSTFSLKVANLTGTTIQKSWYKNGILIPGAIDSVYSILSLLPSDTGKYMFVATNLWGIDSSNIYSLSIGTPPPITIEEQPKPIAVTVGLNAKFTIRAKGSNLFYQWYKNDVVVPNAIYDSLVLMNVQFADNNARITCRVYNTINSIISNPVKLTVSLTEIPPVITVEPISITVGVGDSAGFTVQATGTNLTYQWYRNSIIVPGAITSDYVLPSATTVDNGVLFSCIVSNSLGRDTSVAAKLTVTNIQLPQITQQPLSQSIQVNKTVVFSLVALGPNLVYQWQANETNIIGATQSTYTIAAVEKADSGKRFRCIVSNGAGADTSSIAVLTVVDHETIPVIVTQPQSITVDEGSNATFAILANGTNVQYIWKRNGVEIPGAVTNVFLLQKVTSAENGHIYTCRVYNSTGSVESNQAVLTVHAMLKIKKHPVGLTVALNQPARFSISIDGVGIQFQWFRANQAIAGATDSIYVINSAKYTDNNVTFTCRVSDGTQSAVSNGALLIVDAKPIVYEQPQSISIAEGKNVIFRIKAGGQTPLRYQWQRNGVNINNANNNNYSIRNVKIEQDSSFYRCIVTNTQGADTSMNAQLRVVIGVKITKQPLTTTVNVGANAIFTVEAQGSNIKYQWLKNDTAIIGAATTTLTLPAVKKTDHNLRIQCVVYNQVDTVRTQVVQLKITGESSIVISEQPKNQTVDNGDRATFKVVATGKQLKYQWKRKLSNNNVSNIGTNQTVSFIVRRPMNDAKVWCELRDDNNERVKTTEAVLKVE